MEKIDRDRLLGFLKSHKLMVQASVSEDGSPQAAVVGFAVSDGLEIIFDTMGSTDKMRNLRKNKQTALVVGWENECTVQLRGVVVRPTWARYSDFREGGGVQELDETSLR